MKIIGTKEEIEKLNAIITNCYGVGVYGFCKDCVFKGCGLINHISELDKIEIEVID